MNKKPSKIPLRGLAVATAEHGTTAVAKCLGVSRQAVCKWLKRGWPPSARVVEISAQYGIPRSDLLDPRLAELVDGGMGE